ncbi:hypothetical protein TWF696_003091 [Orbilia brochopaga]|uniref:Zn(2)-C6 fungal-type domain-containing protein n=1 Tax=Orbilia brochopaga TaxID=3140254 RepID=A0AAV9U1Q1_9PEZI
MHPFSGSVVSPLLSPPSSECNSSSKGSVSDQHSLKERQEYHKTGGLNYPLSPMSNSTPPLSYRTSYPSDSTSNGAARSPSGHAYAHAHAPVSTPASHSAHRPRPRLALSTDELGGIVSNSPTGESNLLRPVTPSNYRPRPEFSSPPSQRPDSQSYFPHQSPRQQPFSPPQQPPRRAKAHVPSACVNCKNAHLACDVQRPCPRCISTGKQDSCVDVEHKKRGRPRLRDVRHSFEVARAIDSRSGLNLGGGLPSPGGLNGRGVRLPGPERVGRTSISSRTAPYVLTDPARQDFSTRSMFPDHGALEVPRGQSFESAQYIPPTAFLTTDLVVASSTPGFQDLLGFAAHDLNLRRTVYDLATDSPTDLKNLDRVLRCIRAIIQQEDPHYRTPPSQDVYNVLQRSTSMDLRAGLRGAPVIEEYFDFRRSDSAVIKGFARFYLSRASVYFVAMEVAVVRNRSFTGPSSSRMPEAAGFAQVPHRNSTDGGLLPQTVQRNRSFSSPSFPHGAKIPTPSVPPVPPIPASIANAAASHPPPPHLRLGVPSAAPPGSTYPPPGASHRRDHSAEFKQSQPSRHASSSMSSLRQYSFSSSSYSSTIDTRSPASILSPGVGPIYASPTELTPRTEQIQLPPLRGIPAMNPAAAGQQNREQGNRGHGVEHDLERETRRDTAGEPAAPRRGRIGVREIVE